MKEQLIREFGINVMDKPQYLEVVPKLPRIRFELGVGDTEAGYLAIAESRCRQLLESVTDGESEIWLAMDSYGGAPRFHGGPTMSDTLRMLEGKGVRPMHGDWEIEKLKEDEEVEYRGLRYSALVDANSEGLWLIPRIVVRSDFGAWEGHRLGSVAYFYSPTKRVFYHPYDDCGADLLAPTVEILRPWYERFGDWILDFDRPWIDVMFRERASGAE